MYTMFRFLLLIFLILFFNVRITFPADLYKGFEAFKNKDYLSSYNEFFPLAEDGDHLAQFFVGYLYKNGLSVEKNLEQAIKWYELSAKKGNPYAQNNLALMYEKGIGFSINPEKAFKLYKLSAEQGYSLAQYNLGVMYLNGKGIDKDLINGYMWFSLSSINGDDDGEKWKKFIENEMTENQIDIAKKKLKECINNIYKKC